MEVDGSPSSDDRAAGSVSPAGLNTANGVDPDASSVDPEAVRDEVSSKGGSGGSSCSSARYKLMSPAKLPISRSPCLTIPPGLSPTSFLESPVLLSNVKAEQSPTTGSFFKPYMMHGFASSSMLSTTSGSSAPVDRSEPRGFEFQTSSRPTSFAGLSMADPLASADTSNQHGEQSLLHKFVSANTTKSEAMPSSSSPAETSFAQEAKPICDPSTESGSERSYQRLNSTVEHQPPQSEHAGLTSVVNDRTSEDGYNWRKYGQKLVKGSEYPRSYYKCSHPNCEVKKLFERAPDGQITEIIYKGTHDHPKPQPTRRMPSGGSMMPIQEERSENFLSLTGLEDKPTSLPGKTRYTNDPSVNAELSPRAANDNGIEGGISQVTRLSDDIDDDEDPLAKRRKMEIGGMDISSVIRPIREPRVVVQTLSDVDILDDGYRWRKYGQKVVRGNPNPRSYYKCTSIGCPVRKHVERASHDPKAVITTYEGKHNHDVPTARNNSHDATSNINTTRAQSQQDYDTVSLDLGVGLSPRSRNGSHYPHHHQTRDATGPVLGQHQMGGSNVLFLQQLHAHPVYMNGSMMYASRENCADGINVRNLPPLNHS